MPDWGDGKDTTEKSVIWNDGDPKGKSAQGEIVASPDSIESVKSLRAEVIELLQAGGLDRLRQVLPNNLFVEVVPNDPLPPLPDDQNPPLEDLPAEEDTSI